MLSSSNIIQNVIFITDRLLILTFLNGTAVTVFYVASLLGKTLSMLTGPINSVIISYLIRYRGELTKRSYLKVFGYVSAVSAGAFALCMVVAPFIIRLLYPTVYAATMPILWVAILGQVLFFASDILMTILLRFYGEKYQLYINGVYAVFYVGLTIPALIFFHLTGFAYMVLLMNFAKLILCLIFGLSKIKKAADSS